MQEFFVAHMRESLLTDTYTYAENIADMPRPQRSHTNRDLHICYRDSTYMQKRFTRIGVHKDSSISLKKQTYIHAKSLKKVTHTWKETQTHPKETNTYAKETDTYMQKRPTRTRLPKDSLSTFLIKWIYIHAEKNLTHTWNDFVYISLSNSCALLTLLF